MKNWSNLAKVVNRRTYARRLFPDADFPENQLLEKWEDEVERVIWGNTRGFDVSQHEIDRLRYFFLNRKGGPAGRGWWFSGSPGHLKVGGAGLQNCWFLSLDDWMNFVQGQDLLMLGGGVGISVEHRFVSKLPKIKKGVSIVHKPTKDASFIVPDSREGWNELLRRTLEAFFVTGKGFDYSTVCIRGAGEIIKTFGGVSAGPQPLIAFIEKISALLKTREGKHLRPIDAADLFCAIGEMVVSGNVRRSAIIVLGDCWDKEYLKCKRWDLQTLPKQRGFANWSVVCDDIEDLHPLFWKSYEHGEPLGLVNRKNLQTYGRMGEKKPDGAMGVNPCQPAWATVLTPDGIRTIGDIEIGSTIWSGQQWTKVVNKWSTGVKQVNAYRTTAGTFYGTENHRIVSNGEKLEVGKAESIDTSTGPNRGRVNFDQRAVMDGLLLGDGTFHAASNKNFLIVGKDDESWFDELPDLFLKESGAGPNYWTVQGKCDLGALPKTYDREVPPEYKSARPEAMCSFLRGLYSANGSIVGKRVTLKASSIKVIRSVQEMLSSIGISSYFTTNKPHDVEFSNGIYTCKESYDLNIGTLVGKQLFAQCIGFIQPYKQAKLADICGGSSNGSSKKTFEIVEIERISEEEVFDLTVEADEHTYWTGGLLVSNCAEATLESGESCNLQNIALPNLDSEEEFIELAVLLHRYGKRVAMNYPHWDNSKEVVKRNHRIGTSLTGCLESPLFNPDTLDKVYAAIQEENIKYSKELGIPPSIRTTTINPAGTISKVWDVKGEGIHPGFSRYMIQRIRFSANDPLIEILKQAGHYMEPQIGLDGTLDHNTLVVDFYEEMPSDLPCADEGYDTWKQLEAVKMAQKHWADQAVSVTVYYKREEIPKIKEWLAANYAELKTISFLPHQDHGFKQAPKEAITKEQYEKLSAKIKPIDIEKAQFFDVDVDGVECRSGVCKAK